MPDDVTADVIDNRKRLLARLRATSSTKLSAHDPAEDFGWDKARAKEQLPTEVAAIADLQTRLFAGAEHAVLVVLQAMDAGGKDGVVRDVLRGVNPTGVTVTSFGVPSETDLAHDYLWRIHAHTPPKGTIGVFNRSHYEDVLVVRVKGLAPATTWRKRYDHLRHFEEMLTDEGTHVVKLFLHVSKEEQRLRLQDRVDDPDERWKFRLGDLDDRALWPAYQRAFQDALQKTSTPDAPWYVVPGDRKWVRNLVVAAILRHHLEALDPQYPPAAEGIEGTVVT